MDKDSDKPDTIIHLLSIKVKNVAHSLHSRLFSYSSASFFRSLSKITNFSDVYDQHKFDNIHQTVPPKS